MAAFGYSDVGKCFETVRIVGTPSTNYREYAGADYAICLYDLVEEPEEPTKRIPLYVALLYWEAFVEWFEERVIYRTVEFLCGSICIRGPPVVEWWLTLLPVMSPRDLIVVTRPGFVEPGLFYAGTPSPAQSTHSPYLRC